MPLPCRCRGGRSASAGATPRASKTPGIHDNSCRPTCNGGTDPSLLNCGNRQCLGCPPGMAETSRDSRPATGCGRHSTGKRSVGCGLQPVITLVDRNRWWTSTSPATPPTGDATPPGRTAAPPASPPPRWRTRDGVAGDAGHPVRNCAALSCAARRRREHSPDGELAALEVTEDYAQETEAFAAPRSDVVAASTAVQAGGPAARRRAIEASAPYPPAASAPPVPPAPEHHGRLGEPSYVRQARAWPTEAGRPPRCRCRSARRRCRVRP